MSFNSIPKPPPLPSEQDASKSKSIGDTKLPCQDGSEKIDTENISEDTVYDIEELVEIVPNKNNKTETLVNNRTDKDDDGNYKQFINLDQKIDGKTYPENGRKIVFKAKINRKSGDGELKGIYVKFSYTKEDGPNKAIPDFWYTTELTGFLKEGFHRISSNTMEQTVPTDDNGWTKPVSFFLSTFGGDKFKISVELHPSTPGASHKISSHQYVVWRKFWYQLTYYENLDAIIPTNAELAYKKVYAEMIQSSESPEYKFEEDLPADLINRTIYPEFMLKYGGDELKEVVTVGNNNKYCFTKPPFYHSDIPKKETLKANIIVCEYQCDSTETATALWIISAYTQLLTATMAEGDGGSIICSPALKKRKVNDAGQVVDTGHLVDIGEWDYGYLRSGLVPSNPPQIGDYDWYIGGDIPDAGIEIEHGRGSTLEVEINLSEFNPAPPTTITATNPIRIRLKLKSAEDFLGESFGKGQILSVYKPGTPKGQVFSIEDFNNTVAHELGHMWNQTPEKFKEPMILKPHPLRFIAHDEDGEDCGCHCRHGATEYKMNDGTTIINLPTTKITEEKQFPKFTHSVEDTSNFNKSYPVEINGIQRFIKEITNDITIKFSEAFTANVDDIVIQKDNILPNAIIDNENWDNGTATEPRPIDGDCIMFASFSSKCSNKFCETCKSYLQLQDMSKIKTK